VTGEAVQSAGRRASVVSGACASPTGVGAGALQTAPHSKPAGCAPRVRLAGAPRPAPRRTADQRGAEAALRTRRARSFTLVELLLVVLVLGLLAALAAPALGPAARALGAGSVQYELLRLLRAARWHAADTGRTCLVTLTPAEGGYDAEVVEVDEEGARRPVDQPWAELSQRAEVQRLMRIPPDRPGTVRRRMTVRFAPTGVRADYVVHLGETGGRIEVRRPSGLVWLLGADEPGVLGPGGLERIERQWQRVCGEDVR